MMDSAAMDYFLIEATAALAESAQVATTRAKETEQAMSDAGLVLTRPAASATARDSVTSLTSKSKHASLESETDEPLRVRLETLGMHIGASYAERLCKDRAMFSETLDVIKFICKDVWAACWDKQVDNLRTNHRGVFVLQDNAFKPIARVSSWEGRPEAMKRARMYAAMPAGIIRGVLLRLGYEASVVPEITTMPQCTFQVKLKRV